MVDAVKDLIWAYELITEIGIKQSNIKIYVDNQATIAIANNPLVNSRTRHIMAKTHFLRETLDNYKFSVEYCNTRENLANMFTKAVPYGILKEACLKLGLCERTFTNGGVLEVCAGSKGFTK